MPATITLMVTQFFISLLHTIYMKRHLLLASALVLLSGACQTSRDKETFDGTWRKSTWITETFETLASLKYPRIRAVSYWHERFKDKQGNLIDLRINSSEEALKAYRIAARDTTFTSKPSFLFSGGIARLEPSSRGIYLSAFPDFGGSEDQVTAERLKTFTDLAQHDVAWAYFSNNWYKEIKFPKTQVELLHASGHVPFIRMMMRSDTDVLPDPKYNLQMILDGKFDAELRQWAKDAMALQYPILVEFGPEPNGNWFPWSGRWNGAGESTKFKGAPDGPTRFKLAYRHIINLFRAEGVNNITWFFHANAGSDPDEAWNKVSNYYPGDDYIDWVGLSVYGPQRGKIDSYEPFRVIMDYAYPEIVAATGSKPIAILEFGITECGLE